MSCHKNFIPQKYEKYGSVWKNVRIFAPYKKWPRSLMDRIKDSGSFGPGSNPGGVTFFCKIIFKNGNF